jgi:hypothetical protein
MFDPFGWIEGWLVECFETSAGQTEVSKMSTPIKPELAETWRGNSRQILTRGNLWFWLRTNYRHEQVVHRLLVKLESVGLPLLGDLNARKVADQQAMGGC